MKIISAYLCPDCDEVFDYSKYTACPSCTNKSVVCFLAMLSKRRGVEEAQNINAKRYEKVRTMHPSTFASLWDYNLKTGRPFDTLVDESGASGRSGSPGVSGSTGSRGGTLMREEI